MSNSATSLYRFLVIVPPKEALFLSLVLRSSKPNRAEGGRVAEGVFVKIGQRTLTTELRNWNEIKRTPIQSFPVKSNMAAKSLHMAIDF